jgi:hypothetical protein
MTDWEGAISLRFYLFCRWRSRAWLAVVLSPGFLLLRSPRLWSSDAKSLAFGNSFHCSRGRGREHVRIVATARSGPSLQQVLLSESG